MAELASTSIGAAGGTLEVSAGAYAGARLDIAPGVFGAERVVAFGVRTEDSQFPLEFPVWTIAPEDVPFSGPIDVTIKIGPLHQFFVSLFGFEIELFHRTASGGFVPMRTLDRDPPARTLSAQIDRFGEFVALDPTFYRLLAPMAGPVDPAAGVDVAFAGGEDLLVEEGDGQIQIGQGSLTDFWSSPAVDNVLVLHGFNASPIDFLEPGGLIEQLSGRYQNVVTYRYPSGRSIAESGLALYDQVRASAQPGFGCSIIAHSMGGLVARHAIEQAHRTRGDQPLSEVSALVMLGTPQGGTSLADEFSGLFTVALPPAQQAFLQGATDLGIDSAYLVAANGSYLDNPTLYFVVAGDIGGGTDGVVTLASATQVLPLGPGEDAFVVSSPVAGHTFLHSRARPLGIIEQVFLWLP